MTQRAAYPVELEDMVRSAIASVAVRAFARGIDLAVHIDHRLPARAAGDPEAVTEYLRQGLARTVEAARTAKVAIALWRGEESEPPVLLETGRTLGEGGAPATRLTNIWALSLGEATAKPRPHRRDEHAETVLIALPLVPEPDAPLLAEKWRDVFRGRYMLHVRDVLFDAGRLAASLASLGLEVEIIPSAEAALARAQSRANAGLPVDLVLIDAHPLGPDAIGLARAFRDDPRLADAIIVLAGQHRSDALGPDEARLFNAVPLGARRWQRLIEVFRDLIEARSGGMLPAAGGGQTVTGIPDLAGRRILVAEDVATNQVLLRAIVEPTGASIETVSGGDAVVERHRAEPADLIIMDLQMPGTGGIAAARRIRALPGSVGKVPVVALTAYAGGADRQRAIEAGMDAFLSKPVVVAEFYELLRRLLGSDAEEH